MVSWDDGGYDLVHPALAWPEGTDPYRGLDGRQQQRQRAFDFAEGISGSDTAPLAFLPVTLIEPGDRIFTGDGLREVSTVQPVAGGSSQYEVVLKGQLKGLYADPGHEYAVSVPAGPAAQSTGQGTPAAPSRTRRSGADRVLLQRSDRRPAPQAGYRAAQR